ncbi:MAG: hypothetical protein F4Z50_00010 [Gemmatimonadetes bacterium]|nr:hypothetical protein [Gemmatimonadota bacterium]
MAFRVRGQGTQDHPGDVILARSQRTESEEEGVGPGVGGEALGPQPGEVPIGIVGALAGIAEAAPQDARDIEFLARPADPGDPLAVHIRLVAPGRGCVHRHPFADQGRIRVDSQPGGVAGRLHPAHEMAGGLVEIRVLRSGGGEGVAGRGARDLRRERAGCRGRAGGGGEEE